MATSAVLNTTSGSTTTAKCATLYSPNRQHISSTEALLTPGSKNSSVDPPMSDNCYRGRGESGREGGGREIDVTFMSEVKSEYLNL